MKEITSKQKSKVYSLDVWDIKEKWSGPWDGDEGL